MPQQQKIQIEKKCYYEKGYFSVARFSSYAYQLMETTALEPKSVLEVGKGNGLFSYLLKSAGYELTTLDFDKSLDPDIVASVTDIPLSDNEFDCVTCFQVLEHLPFEMFSLALSELSRVTKKNVLISLPNRGRYYSMRWKFPWTIGKIKWEPPNFNLEDHRFDGEHYWEINKNGYELNIIEKIIRDSGFAILNSYRIFENPYHSIFILEKQTGLN